VAEGNAAEFEDRGVFDGGRCDPVDCAKIGDFYSCRHLEWAKEEANSVETVAGEGQRRDAN